MTHGQKKLIRRITFGIAAVGLLVPVTVSPSQGVEANEACGDDAKCCQELMSMCGGETDPMLHFYWDADGKCNVRELD